MFDLSGKVALVTGGTRAFDHRRQNWGNDNYKSLIDVELPFLNANVVNELNKIDLKGKTIGQFCCNNMLYNWSYYLV